MDFNKVKMYKDKEVNNNVKDIFCLLMEMVHDRCSTLLTGFSTALTTILPILFQYYYKCCYSDSRNLWTVMKAGGLVP